MGIWGAGDMALRGLDELRNCDEVYAEFYTNAPDGKMIPELEKKIKKKITILAREQVEDGKALLQAAEKKKVALIIPGDPLIATTHVSLLLEARKKKIETRIIHASSIFTAAPGEAGLQIYKFGKCVTLSQWYKGYEPMTAYDVISDNLKRGLHTLLLIDIVEGRPLEQKEIFGLLAQMEKKAGKVHGIFAPAREIVVLSRVGSPEQKISHGTIAKLEIAKLGKPPFVLLIPGELHFAEKEALAAFRH
jgi:diphthine synthase